MREWKALGIPCNHHSLNLLPPHTHTNRGTCPHVGSAFTTKAATLQEGSEEFEPKTGCYFFIWSLAVPVWSSHPLADFQPTQNIQNRSDPAKMWPFNRSAGWRAAQDEHDTPPPMNQQHEDYEHSE